MRMPTDDELIYGTAVSDEAPRGFGSGIITGKIGHWAEGWTEEDGYLYLVLSTDGEDRYPRWRLNVED